MKATSYWRIEGYLLSLGYCPGRPARGGPPGAERARGVIAPAFIVRRSLPQEHGMCYCGAHRRHPRVCGSGGGKTDSWDDRESRLRPPSCGDIRCGHRPNASRLILRNRERPDHNAEGIRRRLELKGGSIRAHKGLRHLSVGREAVARERDRAAQTHPAWEHV